jgi:hypothetical protein
MKNKEMMVAMAFLPKKFDFKWDIKTLKNNNRITPNRMSILGRKPIV